MERAQRTKAEGFFAIGIEHGMTAENLGTLWRTAGLYQAAFVFTVGRRYKSEATDTLSIAQRIPLMHFATVDDLAAHLPHGCPLIGVELDERAIPLEEYQHRPRAAYLLGSETHGLTSRARAACHELVCIPCPTPDSMNVAVAGSLVVFDRYRQRMLTSRYTGHTCQGSTTPQRSLADHRGDG